MTSAEERLAFFYNLGLATSQWSFIETGLYQIVAACMHPKDSYAIAFGLFAVDNFRSKLAFSDAILIKKIKDKGHLKEWTKLSERLKRTVTKRNRLAHDRAFFYADSDAGRRYALEHWPSDKPKLYRNMPKPSDGALCVRDIVEIKQEFFYLIRALENFHAKLIGRQLPHPESDAQPNRRQTIRAIRNQIREALELPPLPLRKKS